MTSLVTLTGHHNLLVFLLLFFSWFNHLSRTSASSMSGVYPPMPKNGPVYLERTSGGRSGIVSKWAMVIEEFGEEGNYGKGAWLMPRIPSAIWQFAS